MFGIENFELIYPLDVALSEKELDLLNRMVSAYLDVAEINALNMHAMTMKEWIKELDGFLLGKALRHELTHIYLWETGQQGRILNEEEIADLIKSS